MNLERWLQKTIEIQQIPAPTFSEHVRADYILNEFCNLGLDPPVIDDAGNVLCCVRKRSRASVIICAHLDTVFPLEQKLTIERSHKILKGPGVGDNSVAAAALLEFAYDLKELDLPADIWLAATVGEEGLGNLKGMRHLVNSFSQKNTLYLVLEGMALGTIYHRALPVHRIRLTIRTAGGHSWVHSDRASAIHELVHLGERILKIPTPRKPRTTINIGTIKGGTSINSRADHASFEVDLRSEDEDKLHQFVRKIERLAEKADKRHSSISIERIGERPGGSIPQDHPLVRLAHTAYSRQNISPIELQIGSTDASIPLSLGIPAVCVGLTYGGGAHSDSEFIQIPPMEKGYLAVLEMLIDAAGYISRT